MRLRKNLMTPLAAVVADLLAGAAGTVCLDAVHYLKIPPRRRHGRPPGLGIRSGRELGDSP